MGGYKEFANHYKDIIEDELIDCERGEELNVRAECIKKHFYGRLIIVDEAHNLRNSKGSDVDVPIDIRDTTEVFKFLIEVKKTAPNVKIALMTATPMYDVAREIWHMLRLLDGESDKQPAE